MKGFLQILESEGRTKFVQKTFTRLSFRKAKILAGAQIYDKIYFTKGS